MFNEFKKQTGIKYRIAKNTRSFLAENILEVSYQTLFGFRLWKRVMEIDTGKDHYYDLDYPIKVVLHRKFKWKAEVDNLFKFIETYNTTEKYLAYVNNIDKEFKIKYHEYEENVKSVSKKLNLIR